MSKKKPVKMSKQDAVDIIVKHKADNIKKGLDPGTEYNKHIKKVLKQLNINTSEETVKVFVMGAVDAMIYDVAPTLGFRPSYPRRLEMLREIFTNSI